MPKREKPATSARHELKGKIVKAERKHKSGSMPDPTTCTTACLNDKELGWKRETIISWSLHKMGKRKMCLEKKT